MIRPLADGDIAAVASLAQRLLPTMVVTERTIEHMRLSTSWWVAERGGCVVGAGRTGRYGRCWIGVEPSARGKGVGTSLLAVVEERARASGWREAIGWTDDEAGARFAERHGYRETRRKPVSVLRLGSRPLSPATPPDGVAVVPLVELGERLRDLHALAIAAYGDVPGDGLDASQSFEEWLRDDMGLPDLDVRTSTVVLEHDSPVALALVTTDGGARAENEFTGTHPDRRGAGLATLAKLSALNRAERAGVREVWTGNDAENAPMLAINRKLGFRVSHERRGYAKRLAD